MAADHDDVLKPIIVTATPLSQDPDFLATIVESVNRDQILRSGGANLADALADVPGVTGTSFASGASRPVIRGFDANRVRTLEDGISSFDVSDVGPDHGVPLDPLAADRIEVVRGAATLRYGSQAIGGVVNTINNRVPLELGDKPITGELNAGYGSNADSKEGAAQLNGSLGKFAWHVDGFGRNTTDYDIPGGTQSNSFFRGGGYAGGGSYFFDKNHVGAAIVHYDARYGIPAEEAYIDMKQTKGMLRSSFALDAGPLKTLTVDGGYGDYEHSERDAEGVAGSTFLIKEWDSRIEALFDPVGPFSGIAIGAQLQHKSFSALGEGADYLLPTTTKAGGLFVFAEAPLNQTTRLQTGARVEHVTVDGTPISDVATSNSYTPISISAGVVYDASDALRLGLTASAAARAPAQTELFSRGPHDGPLTFETGDPNLGIERANSLEATLRLRHDTYKVDVSVWGAKFHNYIYGALTGRTCDEEGICDFGDANELTEMNYTQSGATFYGAEAKSTVDLLSRANGKISARFIADYVRAKLSDGAGNVPRIPAYRVGAGLTWEGARIDGGFLVKYAGKHTNVAFAETPTSGFVTLDANVGWRPLLAYPNFELVLVGRNLTDSTQRNSVAFNKDVVILPGKDVRILFRAGF